MLSYRELKKLSELADTHEAYKEVFDFYMDEYRFDPEVLQLTQELMEEKKKLNGGNKPWLEVSKKNT
ncbi:MAG: hypothetical protein LBD11_06010 [Candidatus Peribacteria bacterium]|jgi:hypothetical protein|nr:hypothetical protein [Candidatus Peribacteria bacterium]